MYYTWVIFDLTIRKIKPIGAINTVNRNNIKILINLYPIKIMMLILNSRPPKNKSMIES